VLLSPSLENPMNLEAAQLLIKDESMYRTVVQKLLQESAQIGHGSLELSEDIHTRIRIIKTISFNDYYKTWSGIATTKTTEHSRNSLLKDPNFMGQYYKWKRCNLQHPRQWKLKFGVAKCRFTRGNRLPHPGIHFGERTFTCPSPMDASFESEIETDAGICEAMQEWKNEHSPETIGSDESWENEVDNLVAWTNALDIDSLDNQD
uniref:Uncharacterized protein n=1 Tax=Nannospalax galili TaxID=1026970 RepID=A0A8C6R6E9_NANGA